MKLCCVKVGKLYACIRPLFANSVTYVGQGWNHDSLSGQVEFVPSLSDLHFRIGAIEIFGYGCFEIQNTCSYICKTGGSDDMHPQKMWSLYK